MTPCGDEKAKLKTKATTPPHLVEGVVAEMVV